MRNECRQTINHKPDIVEDMSAFRNIQNRNEERGMRNECRQTINHKPDIVEDMSALRNIQRSEK